MSSTARKQAPRPARPAARYWKGKAPKGVTEIDSDSDEEHEGIDEVQDEDMPLGGVEGGDDDDEEEDDSGAPMKRLLKAQGAKMSIALRDIDISKEGKVIVAGRDESGKTIVEDEEDEETGEEEVKAPEQESEEDESSEEESEEEEAPKPIFRPVFVPKRGRVTVLEREKEALDSEEALEKKRIEEEERRKQSHDLVAGSIRRELAEQEKEKETPDVDDTDGIDPTEGFEAWRLRELGRIKRDKEAQLQRDQEREEVERRRALPEEERMKEDLEHAKKTRDDKSKGQQKFLQKYWHKGAFHQDEDILKKHDYTEATESTIDVTLLPKVMQVRDFGKRSRTKYTHLLDQDTTVGVGGFGGAANLKKPGGGSAAAGKHGDFTNGCFACGGSHLKKDCPNTNPGGLPGTGANASGGPGRSWGQSQRDQGDLRDKDEGRNRNGGFGEDRERSRENGERNFRHVNGRDRESNKRDRTSDGHDRRRDDRGYNEGRDDRGRNNDYHDKRYSRYSRSRSPQRRKEDREERKSERHHQRDLSSDNERREGKRIRTN